jgi:hypothetical protein
VEDLCGCWNCPCGAGGEDDDDEAAMFLYRPSASKGLPMSSGAGRLSVKEC